MRKPYFTLKEAIYYEASSVKGSRFFVNAAPVSSEAEAKEFLEKAHAQFPHARHHCWAMVLRDPEIARPNDDGEPSGSAGKPILAQLQGSKLQDVIIVVSRFFGGTKLGVGGLVRAYGGSAAEAIQAAEIMKVTPKRTLSINFDYSETSLVEATLSALKVTTPHSDYGEKVLLQVQIEDAEVDHFLTEFKDRTAQRVRIELEEE